MDEAGGGEAGGRGTVAALRLQEAMFSEAGHLGKDARHGEGREEGGPVQRAPNR